MKRLALSAALLALWAAPALAQEVIPAPVPRGGNQQVAPALTNPPRHRRYVISSFGVWVRTNGPGYPAYRYTYRGETYGANRPSIFQYGYEHEMQENGPYSLNGQWH